MVKYFTSRVSQRPGNWGKWKRQNTYLEALIAIGDVTFYYGHYIDKSVRCRRCGATWHDAEEKKTDVTIAVELLCDAQDDRFDTAIVVSGDSDLSPPVTAVIARHPQKRVIVAFPPGRHSSELSTVSTNAFTIGKCECTDCSARVYLLSVFSGCTTLAGCKTGTRFAFEFPVSTCNLSPTEPNLD